MPKGRQNVPPSDKVGIWFRHRGADNSDTGLDRNEVTSTGRMLSAPFTAAAAYRPCPAPETFQCRAQSLYKSSNPFSTHDNRNTIQDKGEYFGDGRYTRVLGRRLDKDKDKWLHRTKPEFFKHHTYSPRQDDYLTESSWAFAGRPTSEAPTHRRFPKSRDEPHAGPIRLDTTTTDWFNDLRGESRKQAQTSTRVLAISQQPYPNHNPWKYSYKGRSAVYPPFNPPIKRVSITVDNVFNRYGAGFKTSSDTAQFLNLSM